MGAGAAPPPRGADPARTFPSAVVADTKMPPGSPFLKGRAVNLILSPGFTLVDFHPARTRKEGGFISRFQISATPLALVTSTSNHECGLAHLNCFTIPSCVVDFVWSMPAAEW